MFNVFHQSLASVSSFSYVLHRNRIFLNSAANAQYVHSLWKRKMPSARFGLDVVVCYQAPLTCVPRPLTEAVVEGFTAAWGRGHSPRLAVPLKSKTLLLTAIRSVCPWSPQTQPAVSGVTP